MRYDVLTVVLFWLFLALIALVAGRSLLRSIVQMSFEHGPSGAPLVGSRADRYPRQRSKVGICPRQHGFKIHALADPPRRLIG